MTRTSKRGKYIDWGELLVYDNKLDEDAASFKQD